MPPLCFGFARFVLMLALLIVPAMAQSASLSPQAQNAFDRGLTAAQQQDWKLAVRYFLDAQKIDPDASQIWFNLGLASAKIPGHEFRAIAWFRAYLRANPDANNAPAIRSQVRQLEVAFEGRLNKVIDALEPVAKLIADKETLVFDSPDTPENRKLDRMTYYLDSGGLLAAMRLYLGDKAGAEKTRQKFLFIGKLRQGCEKDICFHVPAHLKRALASVGSYDEIKEFSHIKNTDAGKFILEGGVTDRGLFAAERGDVDTAKMLSRDPGPIACKYYELGRFKDADIYVSGKERSAFETNKANWFDTSCSGWWLKKGDISGLQVRGREGRTIAVKDQNDQTIEQFDDTSIDEYLIAFKHHLNSLTLLNIGGKQVSYGSLSTYQIQGSLTSLAGLFESYRQMHGPYDR